LKSELGQKDKTLSNCAAIEVFENAQNENVAARVESAGQGISDLIEIRRQ
jgi:hypothetical protein